METRIEFVAQAKAGFEPSLPENAPAESPETPESRGGSSPPPCGDQLNSQGSMKVRRPLFRR